MALIKCPACGGTVSDKAPRCPHCSAQLTGTDSLQQAVQDGMLTTSVTPQAESITPPAKAEETQHIPKLQRGVMYGPPQPEPTPAPQPVPVPQPAPQPAPEKRQSRGRSVLYIVLALLFAAACGAGVYIFMDKKQNKTKSTQVADAAGQTAAGQTAAANDDDWDDDDLGCEIYDPIPAGAENLYGNVYAVSTDDLINDDDSWIKPTLPYGCTRAAVFADRIWLRSSATNADNTNKLALIEYGTYLDVVSQYDDKWTEVRVADGQYAGSRGYVSAEFIISDDEFAVMDCNITPDASARESISTAKWRRALADAVVRQGWEWVSGKLIVSTPYKIDVAPRQMIAFRLFDPSDSTAFMAFIEFYEGDEEYRILGCTDDCDVRDITCTSAGTYRLELDFTRSLLE
ncbi:MAG: SH3 domain-containing protein [Alistipes sp.]|nr:SH3 domain-containing protein [Alistipes sp.]